MVRINDLIAGIGDERVRKGIAAAIKLCEGCSLS